MQVRVPKASELIAAQLRRRIVTGELRQGDTLPSDRVMLEQFDVSRPTMREAYRILENEGLIHVRRGTLGGAQILEPSSEVAARYAAAVLQHRGATLDDVLTTLADIEAPAARRLAERSDRRSVAKLLRARHDELLPLEASTYHEFNAYVVELTGSPTLGLTTAMLHKIIQAASVRFAGIPKSEAEAERLLGGTERTRLRLIELVRAGDATGAESLWRKHLTEARRNLVAGVDHTIVDLLS